MSTITALPADSFVDAVGVNVHSWYGVSDPSNAYAGNWIPLVSQLGIRHVRDSLATSGAAGAACLAAATALHATGIDVLYPVPGDAALNGLLNSALPPPAAVEPWNELDVSGPGWASAIQSFAPELHASVKATWPGCKVLGAALANNSDQSQVGNLTPYVDVNNVHIYAPPAQEPEYAPPFAASQLSAHKTQAPAAPVWLTETGLVDGTSTDPAVLTTELAAARLLPRTLLYCFAPTTSKSIKSTPYPTGAGGLGLSRMYMYELLDEHTPTTYKDPNEDRYGLFRSNLSPKLPATAIGNLLALLSDRGPAFTPGSLDLAFTGSNLTAFESVLFQKRDGTFWLAFWMGFNVVSNPSGGGTNPASGTDHADTPYSVGVAFHRPFQKIVLYRPLHGKAPIQTLPEASSISLNARLDVQLLELASS